MTEKDNIKTMSGLFGKKKRKGERKGGENIGEKHRARANDDNLKLTWRVLF